MQPKGLDKKSEEKAKSSRPISSNVRQTCRPMSSNVY